jgi:hypothetical protein
LNLFGSLAQEATTQFTLHEDGLPGDVGHVHNELTDE